MKYTRELLEPAVRGSTSYGQVIDKLGLRRGGGTQANLINRIRSYGLDTSHFVGQAHGKGKQSKHRIPAAEILVNNRTGRREHADLLRRAMTESGIPYECDLCGNDGTWLRMELRLQVDHRDGHELDNRIHNLRFLCPNCHSQTATFGSRNKSLRAKEKRDGLEFENSTTVGKKFIYDFYIRLANDAEQMAERSERLEEGSEYAKWKRIEAEDHRRMAELGLKNPGKILREFRVVDESKAKPDENTIVVRYEDPFKGEF
jgi:hypothetical protein